jgi:hypothetical protein
MSKKVSDEGQNLTNMRLLDSFESQADAIRWYLGLLHDRMSQCIKLESSLSPSEKLKRLEIINAPTRSTRVTSTKCAVARTWSLSRPPRPNSTPCIHAWSRSLVFSTRTPCESSTRTIAPVIPTLICSPHVSSFARGKRRCSLYWRDQREAQSIDSHSSRI